MDTIRTQVYLQRDQHRRLRERAQALNVPMTELLRQIVDEYVQDQLPATPDDAFGLIVALGVSKEGDVAEEHDRYLVETLSDEHLR